MRSRWLLGAAVLGGVLACPLLAFLFLGVFAPFTYGMFDSADHLVTVAFLIFTVLTVPVGLLAAWKGTTPLQRGVAAGVLIGWAAIGLWVWMGVPGVEIT